MLTSVSDVFGETAAAINIDLLKYNPVEKRGILRVPKELYVKVRASLTLSGEYEDIICAYTVHKATPILLGLTGMSTTVWLYLSCFCVGSFVTLDITGRIFDSLQ